MEASSYLTSNTQKNEATKGKSVTYFLREKGKCFYNLTYAS